MPGVAPAVFNVIAPVYLVGAEPKENQFVMALTPDQVGVDVDSTMETALRRYLLPRRSDDYISPFLRAKS